MLDRTTALLRPRFDVVSTAANGKLLVDEAIRLEPDVVVLDIAMPVLDGIRAAEELRRRGSSAKVVFLSMHREDDYIVAALGSGAQAYVFKSRIALDLEHALDTVLRGRMFVSPSPSTASATAAAAPPLWWKHGSCRHIAQYYSSHGLLLDELSHFFCSALTAGDKALVIATEETRDGIEQRLQARGIDISAAARERRYLAWDATEGMAKCVRGGKLDAASCASSFRIMVSALIEADPRGSFRIAGYGEMAPLFYAEGHPDWALQMEQLFSDVGMTDSMYVVCGYPATLLHSPDLTNLLGAINDEHCSVSLV
jgi:CheY-like chemotaxis protein